MTPADVVTVGETMIMLVPEHGKDVTTTASFAAYVGGAESNVATYLARMGSRVRWSSVMRDEPLARRISAELDDAGVDTSAIVWQQEAQTGLYLKDPRPEATSVYYYRQGSAARLLDASLWDDERLRQARILHLSGVTAALSPGALRLLETAIVDRCSGAGLVTFDVNFRQGLWSAAEAAPVLRDLANASDVAFVGLDEAWTLWRCTSPDDVRRTLPDPGMVVVKDGPVGAYALGNGASSFVSSPRVQVVEPVGAGDAFAAGYLKGLLGERGVEYCLRFGHLLAATALSIHGDTTEPPPAGWLDGHLALSEEDWDVLAVDAPVTGRAS